MLRPLEDSPANQQPRFSPCDIPPSSPGAGRSGLKDRHGSQSEVHGSSGDCQSAGRALGPSVAAFRRQRSIGAGGREFRVCGSPPRREGASGPWARRVERGPPGRALLPSGSGSNGAPASGAVLPCGLGTGGAVPRFGTHQLKEPRGVGAGLALPCGWRGTGRGGSSAPQGLAKRGAWAWSCLPVIGEEAGSSWALRARWAGAAERGRGWARGRKQSHVIPHKLFSWTPPGLGAVLSRGLGSGRCCSGTSRGVYPPHQPLSPQMAQRLALQRLLALPTRGPLASHGRAFGTSAGRRSTFNVQDGSDFQNRVVNSPKPVVVDFHAQ